MSPIPLTSEIQAIEKRIGAFLDPTHLILAGLLIVALLFGVYLFESKRAEEAEAKTAIAQQAEIQAQKEAANSAAQNALIQQNNTQVQAQLTQANQQLLAANKQLQASNASLTSALVTRQTTDAQLAPAGQAQRWMSLVPNSTVTAIASGFTVDANGGLATLQQLEELPVDRSKIENFTSEIATNEQVLENEEKALQSEKDAHASDILNDAAQLKVVKDQTAVVQAQFNTYKARARRNYIRAFFVGVAVGITGTRLAGF